MAAKGCHFSARTIPIFSLMFAIIVAVGALFLSAHWKERVLILLASLVGLYFLAWFACWLSLNSMPPAIRYMSGYSMAKLLDSYRRASVDGVRQSLEEDLRLRCSQDLAVLLLKKNERQIRSWLSH